MPLFSNSNGSLVRKVGVLDAIKKDLEGCSGDKLGFPVISEFGSKCLFFFAISCPSPKFPFLPELPRVSFCCS